LLAFIGSSAAEPAPVGAGIAVIGKTTGQQARQAERLIYLAQEHRPAVTA
jgi:hypothetical protein